MQANSFASVTIKLTTFKTSSPIFFLMEKACQLCENDVFEETNKSNYCAILNCWLKCASPAMGYCARCFEKVYAMQKNCYLCDGSGKLDIGSGTYGDCVTCKLFEVIE